MAYKILKDYEKYAILDDGRIWSRTKKVFMKKCLNKDGYPQTMFNRKSECMHRVIAKAFVPNPNNLPEVNHIDGIKTNIHYLNLEWCTRSQNIKHCHKLKLRSSKGNNNGNSKINNDIALTIRDLYKNGINQNELALKFNVTQATISSIILNKTWIN